MEQWAVAVTIVAVLLAVIILALIGLYAIRRYNYNKYNQEPSENPSTNLNPYTRVNNKSIYLTENDKGYDAYAKDYVVPVRSDKKAKKINIGECIFSILAGVDTNKNLDIKPDLSYLADAIENLILKNSTNCADKLTKNIKTPKDHNLGHISYNLDKNDSNTSFGPLRHDATNFMYCYVPKEKQTLFKKLPATVQNTLAGIIRLIDLILIYSSYLDTGTWPISDDMDKALTAGSLDNVAKVVGPAIIKFFNGCKSWDETSRPSGNPDYNNIKYRKDWEPLLCHFMSNHPILSSYKNAPPTLQDASKDTQQLIASLKPISKPFTPLQTINDAKDKILLPRQQSAQADRARKNFIMEFCTQIKRIYHEDLTTTVVSSTPLADIFQTKGTGLKTLLNNESLKSQNPPTDLNKLLEYYLPPTKDFIDDDNHRYDSRNDKFMPLGAINMYRNSKFPSVAGNHILQDGFSTYSKDIKVGLQDALLDWICSDLKLEYDARLSTHLMTTPSHDPSRDEFWGKDSEGRQSKFGTCKYNKEVCKKYFAIMLNHFNPVMEIITLLKVNTYDDIINSEKFVKNPNLAKLKPLLKCIYGNDSTLTIKERLSLITSLLLEQASHINIDNLYNELTKASDPSFNLNEFLDKINFFTTEDDKDHILEPKDKLQFIYDVFSRTMVTAASSCAFKFNTISYINYDCLNANHILALHTYLPSSLDAIGYKKSNKYKCYGRRLGNRLSLSGIAAHNALTFTCLKDCEIPDEPFINTFFKKITLDYHTQLKANNPTNTPELEIKELFTDENKRDDLVSQIMSFLTDKGSKNMSSLDKIAHEMTYSATPKSNYKPQDVRCTAIPAIIRHNLNSRNLPRIKTLEHTFIDAIDTFHDLFQKIKEKHNITDDDLDITGINSPMAKLKKILYVHLLLSIPETLYLALNNELEIDAHDISTDFTKKDNILKFNPKTSQEDEKALEHFIEALNSKIIDYVDQDPELKPYLEDIYPKSIYKDLDAIKDLSTHNIISYGSIDTNPTMGHAISLKKPEPPVQDSSSSTKKVLASNAYYQHALDKLVFNEALPANWFVDEAPNKKPAPAVDASQSSSIDLGIQEVTKKYDLFSSLSYSSSQSK